MLLSFTVSNFRSFYEEQTLSMVAGARQPDHPNHLSPIADDEHKALPLAVIYGANGAGKSNLVKALSYLQNLVTKGTEPKKRIGQWPFALHAKAADEPTELRIQFEQGGRVYALGVKVNDRVIVEEWLSIVQHGREYSVYERVTRENNKVEIEAGPVLRDEKTWGAHGKALTLVELGPLPNQLFLFAVSNNLQEEEQGTILSDALKWFEETLTIIPPQAHFSGLSQLLADDPSFGDFASDFLRRVATGVNRLGVKTRELDDDALATAPDELRQMLRDLPAGETVVFSTPNGELHLKRDDGDKLKIHALNAEHVTNEGKTISLPFSEESDGTQRLTHLLPALHSVVNDGHVVYVIDEIDRSLHPLLAKGFVRAFLQACAPKRSQIIFTTHELAFMDLDLLRRDEIWFAAKKIPEGSTELYSLADYKVRTDLKIDKAYLQGRFEAIPPIETELPKWVQDIKNELEPSRAGKANSGDCA